MLSFNLTTFRCALLLIVCMNVALARTRYEEYDFEACQTSPAIFEKRISPRLPDKWYFMASKVCLKHCELQDFPHGGCDCVTKKCVCADMNLNFCNFQEVRLYI